MRLNEAYLAGILVGIAVVYVISNLNSKMRFAVDPETENVENITEERNFHNSQRYQHVTPSLAELGSRGNLPIINDRVLMVTRVPDAGGELLVLILQRLQGYNLFKHIRLPPGDHGLLSSLRQELLVEEITGIVRNEAIPLSLDGDIRFLNFSKFARPAPTFSSLVRNPLNKASHLRFPGTVVTGTQHSRAIPHFCGQDRRCIAVNDKWALKRAKKNVIEWYPVVGILECIEETLKVLNKKLPYFFNGATSIYKRFRPKDKYSSYLSCDRKSREKRNVNESFTHELEFYEWLKTRLLNQAFND